MYRKIFAFLARPQRLGFSIGINLLLRCSKWPTQSETPTGPQNCLGENSVKTSQLSTGANILSGNPKSATHVHSRSSAVHGLGSVYFEPRQYPCIRWWKGLVGTPIPLLSRPFIAADTDLHSNLSHIIMLLPQLGETNVFAHNLPKFTLRKS